MALPGQVAADLRAPADTGPRPRSTGRLDVPPGGEPTNPRALTWTAYLLMAGLGYLIYAVGFITPYVQAQLGVPSWVAALPNSAMAVGTVIAGIVAGRVNSRIGPRYAARLWSALAALSGLLLAIPVSIAPILLGAFVFGVSAGGMLVHVNSALGSGGTRKAGTLLMRANMWSVVGSVAGPLVLSAAARSIGWSWGSLVPVPFLVALVFLLPASPARDRVDGATGDRAGARPGDRTGGLPRAYWLTWIFLALCISAEFSFVVWGSQVVVARAGITNADATGLASLYVAGMITGRLALSTGLGSGPRTLPVLRACVTCAAVGSVILWLAAVPALAGLGLFLGGLGISGIYPLGASLALAHAPETPVRASARLTAASGLAIFTAPLALGFVAGPAGVIGAWLIVFGLLGVALFVLLQIPKPPAPVAPVAPLAPVELASGA